VNALAIGVRPDRVAVDDLVVALLLVVDQDADDAEGKVELAETSAMDRMSWQRTAMARRSTVSFGVRSTVEVVETSVSISRAS
jgi:hypothetical protein